MPARGYATDDPVQPSEATLLAALLASWLVTHAGAIMSWRSRTRRGRWFSFSLFAVGGAALAFVAAFAIARG